MLRRAFISLLLAAFVAFPAEAKSPAKRIDGFHETLLTIMQNAGELGFEGRYNKLAPKVKALFDAERMIRLSMGRHWKDASKEERAQLTDAFRRFTATNYAAQFRGFSGERLETLGERPGPQNTMLVDTRIVRPEKGPVPITYVMKKNKSKRWMIVDVLLDGSISELARRKSEYSLVLRRGGPAALNAVLEKKMEMLQRGEGLQVR